MNNDVLALKYRPRFFKDVMGQDIAVETLQNSLELNNSIHLYTENTFKLILSFFKRLYK